MIKEEKYKESQKIIEKLILGDLISEPSLFKNFTGFDFYFNYLHTEDHNHTDYFSQWVQRPDVRKAIHVGNRNFGTDSEKIEKHLEADLPQSVAYLISNLLQHYRISLHTGQLDIIVAYPLTREYLLNVDWLSAKVYKTATRKQWRVGDDLAGYAKTLGNLFFLLKHTVRFHYFYLSFKCVSFSFIKNWKNYTAKIFSCFLFFPL